VSHTLADIGTKDIPLTRFNRITDINALTLDYGIDVLASLNVEDPKPLFKLLIDGTVLGLEVTSNNDRRIAKNGFVAVGVIVRSNLNSTKRDTVDQKCNFHPYMFDKMPYQA
jgi:hypothetical protein